MNHRFGLGIAAVLCILGLLLQLFGVDVWDFGDGAFSWFAAGEFASGVFAAGTFAVGIFSVGVFSVGVFSLGLFSVGIWTAGLFIYGVYARRLKVQD